LSWVPSSFTARTLLALALAASAGAASADILVLRADGPSAKSFPPGRRLPDNARLVLKPSDELIVLDSRGTRTIRGPGNFVAGVAPPAVTAAATPVVQRRARIGAVRGVPTENRPPSIWAVDVAKSSNMCVLDPSMVSLWRADSSAPATLTITRLPDGATRQLNWEAGASTLAWPADLAVANGGQYRLSLASGAPASITFKTLAERPSGLDDTASVLLANQCSAQLDLFIDTVKTDSSRG
jgi:hypothetical protein